MAAPGKCRAWYAGRCNVLLQQRCANVIQPACANASNLALQSAGGTLRAPCHVHLRATAVGTAAVHCIQLSCDFLNKELWFDAGRSHWWVIYTSHP